MKLNKKGFTLAELLIVVAIIAVLIAIAIPVFGAQLENARDSQSVANIRSAYAQAIISDMQQESLGDATYIEATDTDGAKVAVSDVKLRTTDQNFGNSVEDLPCEAPTWANGTQPGSTDPYTVTFTFPTNGKATCEISQ